MPEERRRECDWRCWGAKPDTQCECECCGKNHAKGVTAYLEANGQIPMEALFDGSVQWDAPDEIDGARLTVARRGRRG